MASPRSSGTAGRDSPNPSFNEPFQFDEQKLLSNVANPEKQELYVFNWLANLEKELKKTDKETMKPIQTNLEKQLLKFMSFTSPKPSRPIRQLIARCFVIIYIKGDSRTLFDTITTLQSFVNAGKGASEKEKKLVALHCVGIIMKSIGDRVLSLLPETINICLKTTKNTSNPLIIRLEAINTITRALEGAAKGATELFVKDIMKQLRAGLNDKALIIRDATVKCMHSVAKNTHQLYPITANELDQLLSQMVKVLDGSNQTIRRSVAAYISTLLAGTQGEVDFLASSTVTKNKTSTTSHPSSHSSQTPGSPTLGSSSDPVKVVLSVEEMLTHLSSIYNKPSTTRDVRSAIIETYSALFIKLGTKYVELNYAEIARHLLKELVSHPKNANSRYDTLSVREHCGLLLRDVIGTRLLSEQGQVTAVRELVHNWVKQWPASTHTQVEPTKLSLVCAVNEISGLLLDLGGAASTVSDILVDPLINLLSHPSYSVQIAAAWCLRCLCYSLPIKLSELIKKILSLVNKDLNNLTNNSVSSDLPKRTLGHAYGLAALLSVVPARPLYVSFELSARVFSISTQLIKSSANKDLAIASIHLQVAWILIGSLMCLGPNFVKLHLPQLLLLWKTALPKPVSKDFVSNRTESELTFMLHVRECVLGAMLSCLLHNSKLITPDVAKRLVALLNNTLIFSTLVATSSNNINTLSNSATSVAQQFPSTSLKFSERENMLKRRILQCFIAIRPISSYDNLSSQLLKMCLSHFADPEKNIGSAITAAIAAVSGSFTSVWTTGDEYAYGVSSRLQGMTVDIANVIDSDQDENSRGVAVRDWLNRDLIESRLENQLEQPIIGAPEYDSIMIYTTYWISPANSITFQIPKPVPAASALVDYSIELFALIFPLQSALVQESHLEQLIKAVRHPKLEKSPGRKMALQVNMVVCLLAIFKNIMNISGKKGETSVPGIADKKVGALAMELLQEAIIHPDAYLRHAASDALGRLLSVVGGNMVPTQMQLLVDQVVNNRDPDTRAGSALALGSIYSHVGGMAAGGHLKTLIGILLSLSSDPHPVVHFWALYALSKIIDSAGPMFSQYVSSTLGIIAKLYMADTHEPCGSTVGTTNVRLGLSAYQQFGKIIYGLIGTLGPELQTNPKVRNLCLNLMTELRNDDDQSVIVESIRCLQHFIMLAQQYVDLPRLVAFLQFQFSSMHFPLKEVAITCLYQLVQRNAKHVFEIAAPGLDNQLFSLLDTDPKVDGVKDIVKSWLSQTALENPSLWVELCRKVMSRTGSVASAGAPVEPPTLDITGDGGDEEGEGFGIEQPSGINVSVQRRRSLEKKAHLSSDTMQIPPRWRTQLFALKCLHQVVEIVHASGDKDQFNLAVAKKGEQAGKDYLVLKVAELIKMAFTASTAVVGEMRLEGLTLLRDVIEKFSATPDPDFEEAALLEQYQAQIGAALTPAFTADSSPEILSAAVKVCAVFVGSGIVKELHRMGRILKLLTTALENCKDNSSVTKVGDFKDLSPHAAIMVKLSVLNAWAELQVASTKQDYLVQVVQPNLLLLCPLWVLTLKEYARVQIEPDITDAQANVIGTGSMQNTAQTDVFDSMYSGLTREVILPYYNMSWLTILGAVASLAQKEHPYIILALNEEEITTDDNDISKHDDDFDDFGDDNNEFSDDFTSFSLEKEPEPKKVPAKFFFILFGLCVEALSNTFGGGSRSSSIGNNIENQKIVRTCIDALKAFLRPVVAGSAFLDEYVFIELINLFDRLVLTEGFKVQYDIIQIIGNIIKDFGAAYICKDIPKKSMKINGHNEDEATVEFPEIETILFHILRLLVNIFFQKIPSLSNRPEVMRIFRLPQGNARGQTSHETTILLKFTIDSFTSLITIVPSKLRVDLAAIAFYVYISIIQDPKFQSELVPHVLVNIKLLCENISTHLEEEEFYTLSRVVHSTISSTLLQINSLAKSQDVLKGDEVSVIKNSLLTATILFTSCPKQCTENTAIQTEFMEILKNGFYSENDTIAITSFQCTRTLMLLSAKKETNVDTTASLQMSHIFIKTLIPEIATFLQKKKDTYGTECTFQEDSYKLDVIEESIKTLLTTNTIAQDSHKTVLMAVTLPTLIQLLADPPLEKYMSSSEENLSPHTLPPLHTLSIRHILSLAGLQPQNFRDAVAVLLPEPKAKLEAAVRFNVLQQQQQQQRLQEERDRRYNERIELNKGPSISLKSDFSGFA